MPKNTLLEPANVVAAWGDQNEEAKEVSVTLKAMRQKYDKIHQVVLAKQEELDNLKRQLEKAGEEEIHVNYMHDTTEDTIKGTKDALDLLMEDHEFEKLTQKQYEFVKKRMQADLVSS